MNSLRGRQHVVELGAACLIAAPFACLYAVGRRCSAPAATTRRLVDSVAAGRLRALRAAHRRGGGARGGLPALGLLGRARRRPLVDHDPALLQADRDVVEPGRLAAALGLGALDRVERRALPHPQPPPRGRAVRDRGARRARALLHRADARSAPIRSSASALAPAEGAGLNPLLRHPTMAIHPPMLYSGYVLWSIPFAFAIGALITRRLDASWIRQHAAVRADRLDLPRRSGSCSAPAGPTPSSAGAATGGGTRSRTPR